MVKTPEPIPLKILKGRSATKDIAGRPIPVPPAFERTLPEPPPWLDATARAEWTRVGPALDALGLIKDEDCAMFATYCETYSSYVAAVAAVREQGSVLTNPQTGHRHKNPMVTIVEIARRDLRLFARDFGLTPAAEALLGKLSVPVVDDENDPFAAGGGYDQ
jgi:P27 family predicted phage terminase small subunit